MKSYVYFTLFAALAGCAYGVPNEADPHHDAGILHADGGAKDAKATQDAGVQDSSVDLPDVPIQTQCSSLPLPTGIPACDSCLGSSCCSEDQGCGYDQDCMALISCLDACMPTDGGPPDQNCEMSCESQYPNGMNELNALDSCMQNSCMTDCQ